MTTISSGRPGRALLLGVLLGMLSDPLAASPDPAAQHPAAAKGPQDEYVISAGDVLRVFVWKENELTVDVTVRIDGRITVPLLGDVRAGGRTPQELSAEISTGLSRFIEAPVVSVTVTQANSARVFVIGLVRSPGTYPLTGRLTVLQALALAGGFAQFAKTDRILVIRELPASPAVLQFNYKKIEDGEPSQNATLRPGDTIVVP